MRRLVLVLVCSIAAFHGLGAQQTVEDARARASAPAQLTATRHAPLPTDVSQYWFVHNVPGASAGEGRANSAALARFAKGVQAVASEDFAAGLSLLNSPDVNATPLAGYSRYYTGVALAGLSRFAEADAIFLKLEAEARGQYELLAKKGDGLKQIVNACGGSTQAFQMLMLEHLDNLADASARAISNIKFDKVVVWEGGGNNGSGRTGVGDFLTGMARTLPPMMQVMKDIGGVELPESLVKLGGDEPAGGVAKAEPPKTEPNPPTRKA